MTTDALRRPWMTRLSTPAEPKCLAGHEIILNLQNLFPNAPKDVSWRVGETRGTGYEVLWTPREPGNQTLVVKGKTFLRKLVVRVGIRPNDLQVRRDALDHFLCLVIRQRAQLHFLPLLHAAERENKAPSLDRKQLAKEVASGHPAFARLMRAQSHLYHKHIRTGPFIDLNTAPSGLYAIFPNDAIYLGDTQAIRSVIEAAPEILTRMRRAILGRGVLLSKIAALTRGLDVGALKLDDRAYYRGLDDRRSAFSIGRFTSRALVPLIAEADVFARELGFGDGLGTASSLFTFNGANGALTSRLFDPASGFSRQVTSAFDLFGGKGQRGVFDIFSDVFGRGTFCVAGRQRCGWRRRTGRLDCNGWSGAARRTDRTECHGRRRRRFGRIF